MIGRLIDCLKENPIDGLGTVNGGSTTAMSSLKLATTASISVVVRVGTLEVDKVAPINELRIVHSFLDG